MLGACAWRVLAIARFGGVRSPARKRISERSVRRRRRRRSLREIVRAARQLAAGWRLSLVLGRHTLRPRVSTLRASLPLGRKSSVVRPSVRSIPRYFIVAVAAVFRVGERATRRFIAVCVCVIHNHIHRRHTRTHISQESRRRLWTTRDRRSVCGGVFV